MAQAPLFFLTLAPALSDGSLGSLEKVPRILQRERGWQVEVPNAVKKLYSHGGIIWGGGVEFTLAS